MRYVPLCAPSARLRFQLATALRFVEPRHWQRGQPTGAYRLGSELSLVGLMQRDAFTRLDINITNTNSLFNSPLINAPGRAK